MNISLVRADATNAEKIHEMQITGYKALLEKYGDRETNPGAETLEKVRQRFSFELIDHYYICLRGDAIGYIRVHRVDENSRRLSMMFILPEFQNNGYAQAAIRQAESLYPEAGKWSLDTIKQEPKLRHLYEKMGYKITGIEKNIKPGMDLVFYEKHTRRR